MYDFAKKIGGDKVEVINLVPAGTEPHDWEPSTKDLIEMEKSDIFIYKALIRKNLQALKHPKGLSY